MARRPVQVIAVTGGKGGVGKSNVSVNLAIALAEMGRRVVVLDADLGLANLEIMLGMAPRYTLHHVVEGAMSLPEIGMFNFSQLLHLQNTRSVVQTKILPPGPIKP